VSFGGIFVSLMLSAVSQDANWTPVASATTGTVWKMRRTDVSNETDLNPTVWVVLDHSRDKTKIERETKQLINFDCRKKSYQILSSIKYRSDGTVISSDEEMANPYRHSYAPPDSVVEGAMLAACPVK